MNDIKQIRKLLPHGAILIIAKKTGTNTATVSRTLRGNDRSPKRFEIIKAAGEFLAEFKQKEDEANAAVLPFFPEIQKKVNHKNH